MIPYTFTVVSHVDFQAHKNAIEIINLYRFDLWKRAHHECECIITNDNDAYLQIAEAVKKHARKNWNSYGLNPAMPLDIYLFATTNRMDHTLVRDIKTWVPRSRNNFVFVTSSGEKDHENDSIIFIKLWTSLRELKYCGTLSFSEKDLIASKLPHIRNLCGVTDIGIRLIQGNRLRFIDTTKTFENAELCSGSVLIAQQGPKPQDENEINKIIAKLSFPLFGSFCYDNDSRENFKHIHLGISLLEQARAGQFTDITLVSTPKHGVEQIQLPTHRNVLTCVPYFRTLFNIGEEDSRKNSIIEAPEWVSPSLLEDFHTFVYCGGWPATSELTVEKMTDLLRLADFYSYDRLMDGVAREFRDRTFSLTDQNVLNLLKLLDTIDFPERYSLETFLLEYVKRNFSRIGKTVEFKEAFGSSWYFSLIDGIAHRILE